jgi:hypothetical protein
VQVSQTVKTKVVDDDSATPDEVSKKMVEFRVVPRGSPNTRIEVVTF